MCQLSKFMILKSQNIYLYYHRSYTKLTFNDSIVTSTEILNDSDLNNLNNIVHKATKLGLVVKVHVRNGLPTLKS